MKRDMEMTENKRFRQSEYIYSYGEITENGVLLSNDKIVKLLNALHEENEQLKKFIKRLTNSNGEIILIDGRAYLKSYVGQFLEDLE